MVPVQEGLFDDGQLIGGRCGACGEPHFPLLGTCPYCSADEVERVALSAEGSLWAWTAVTAPPPGYEGEVPFGFGVVELPEGLRVITRLTEADPARLRFGQAMQLEIVPLQEGVVTYAFAPVP